MNPSVLLDYYHGVKIDSSTFFLNALSMRRFDVAQEWSSLGKPVDRDEWVVSSDKLKGRYEYLTDLHHR